VVPGRGPDGGNFIAVERFFPRDDLANIPAFPSSP